MTNPPNTDAAFDFTPFWPILQDAMRRDPRLAELMKDPEGKFTAEDWQSPDTASEDTPSGHGSDQGIYATKGHLAIMLMENDPKEQYDNLPTLDNYCVQLETTDPVHQVIRTVKLEHSTFEILINSDEIR